MQRRGAAALVLLLAAVIAGAQTPPGPSTTTAWDDRGSLVLSAQAALDALAALPADAPAPVSWGAGGSREGWFGESWQDVDGDGCDTRNEILARDLEDADFSRDAGRQTAAQGQGAGAAACPNATVWSGTLQDPYTGRLIDFVRGKDTSAEVQIDHVIPLSYLYAHGAWQWDARTRSLIANDPVNLLAVDGQANEDKSGCGPATCPVGSSETGTWDTAGGGGWWPPANSFRCTYAQRFVTVASLYSLGLPDDDVAALRDTLTSCASGGDGARSPVDRVRGAVRWARAALGIDRRSVVALAAAAALLLVGGGLIRSGRRRYRDQ